MLILKPFICVWCWCIAAADGITLQSNVATPTNGTDAPATVFTVEGKHILSKRAGNWHVPIENRTSNTGNRNCEQVNHQLTDAHVDDGAADDKNLSVSVVAVAIDWDNSVATVSEQRESLMPDIRADIMSSNSCDTQPLDGNYDTNSRQIQSSIVSCVNNDVVATHISPADSQLPSQKCFSNTDINTQQTTEVFHRAKCNSSDGARFSEAIGEDMRSGQVTVMARGPINRQSSAELSYNSVISRTGEIIANDIVAETSNIGVKTKFGHHRSVSDYAVNHTQGDYTMKRFEKSMYAIEAQPHRKECGPQNAASFQLGWMMVNV